MPTLNQKRALEAIRKQLVGKRKVNIGKAMREAGYSDYVSETPQKLTESKGFREIAREVGLTEDLVTFSLKKDIEAKPKRRVQELRLASEILGMTSKTEGGSEKVNVNILVYNDSEKQALKANKQHISGDNQAHDTNNTSSS